MPSFLSLSRTNLDSLRFFCLCAAIVVYGLYGSPTPDHPGWIEIIVGILLVLAVSPAAALDAVRPDFSAPFWHGAGQILLIFGLVFPLAFGVWAGHSLMLIFRDVVPFIFMLLPVFLVASISANYARFRVSVLLVLALGLFFAVRAAGGDGPLAIVAPFLGRSEKLHYLANMPSVLFASIYFAGSAAMLAVRRFTPKALVTAVVLGWFSLVCLWPLAMTQQRAGLGFFTLSLIPILLLCLVRYPGRTMWLLAPGMILAVVVFREDLFSVLEVLIHKSEIVGSNRRFDEVSAVWSEIRGNPFTFLFGEGWGARFSSPAVAGITVNFTHGLFSSLLLKTGAIGLVLGLSYIFGIMLVLLKSFRSSPVFVMALAGPILIDVFLYASFKSLDFGLVLLLAAAGVSGGDFYGDERG